MPCTAIVDRFLANKVKKNSLTIIEKYHFEDYSSASEFVRNLKRLDSRVITTKVLED